MSIETNEPVAAGVRIVSSPIERLPSRTKVACASRSVPRTILKFAALSLAASVKVMLATADHSSMPPFQAAFSSLVQADAVVKK